MKSLLGIVVFVMIWQLLHLLFPSSLVLPSPFETFVTLTRVMSRVTLLAILSTLWKGLLAMSLVILVGLPLGFLMGINESVYEFLRPIVTVVQVIPVVSWLAVVIFLWGIGWKGPVVITFLALLPIAVFNTASGVKSVDRRLLEVMRVYRVPKGKVFRYVYLGSLLPFVVSILDVCVGNVWKTILMAEFLCGNSGLGVLISWARQYVDVPRVYALTILAVALGIASERILRVFTKRMRERWGFY